MRMGFNEEEMNAESNLRLIKATILSQNWGPHIIHVGNLSKRLRSTP